MTFDARVVAETLEDVDCDSHHTLPSDGLQKNECIQCLTVALTEAYRAGQREALEGMEVSEFLSSLIVAEVKRLRADAERYRWLRMERQFKDAGSEQGLVRVAQAHHGGGRVVHTEDLDAICDAARVSTAMADLEDPKP